jgi:hypothetical protein
LNLDNIKGTNSTLQRINFQPYSYSFFLGECHYAGFKLDNTEPTRMIAASARAVKIPHPYVMKHSKWYSQLQNTFTFGNHSLVTSQYEKNEVNYNTQLLLVGIRWLLFSMRITKLITKHNKFLLVTFQYENNEVNYKTQ